MAQFTIPARDKTTEMRFQMGYALADLAAEHPRIVALDADLRTSSGLHIFEHFHPDKLVKVGIAEQNLMAISAGLSQEGYIPFPCTFDAFCRRYMDQLYVTVAYGNLNVKVLGAYAGLFTGKAGATHQSDKELGILLRIPNLTVIEPGCNDEMAQALRVAVETPGPFYLRIVRCEVAQNEVARRLPLPTWQRRDGGGRRRRRRDRVHRLHDPDRQGGRAKAQGQRHPGPRGSSSVAEAVRPGSGARPGREGARHRDRWRTTVGAAASTRWWPRRWLAVGCGVPVGAIGTDPDDFIHTGHVNDLLDHYEMTSEHVVQKVVGLLTGRAR